MFNTPYHQISLIFTFIMPGKMTLKKLPALPLIAAFFLVSCFSVKEPELKGIGNVKLGGMSLKASTLFLDIQYFNPNPFKVKLKNASGDAWIDGNKLGHFTIDSAVTIPANATFLLPVKMDVDMKKLLTNSLSLFMNNEVLLKVEGIARLGKAGFFINYPLKYEGKQNFSSLMGQGSSKP
jgi:LEA14-like dessication related protein